MLDHEPCLLVMNFILTCMKSSSSDYSVQKRIEVIRSCFHLRLFSSVLLNCAFGCTLMFLLACKMLLIIDHLLFCFFPCCQQFSPTLPVPWCFCMLVRSTSSFLIVCYFVSSPVLSHSQQLYMLVRWSCLITYGFVSPPGLCTLIFFIAGLHVSCCAQDSLLVYLLFKSCEFTPSLGNCSFDFFPFQLTLCILW